MAFSRSIFLTGFPGFIAERLVARLIDPGTQFFLLVQPQFVGSAAASVERLADAAGVPLENFALIEGDVTLPGLGIPADDLKTIREETTEVFHLAAVYDLAVDRETAMAVNLEGTRNVNDLCRSIGDLTRYNYVSTCYVAGKRTGRILETELTHSAGFRNFYEESKYLAEIEVEELKEILPATIYRPSVVVGDSTTGETAKYDGIYYLIGYLLRSPSLLRLVNVGSKDVRLNLVPVDFVADSIAELSADPLAVGETVAIADPSPLTTATLFDVIAESLTGKRSVLTPPASLVQSSLMLSVSPGLTGLPHAGVPYFFLSQEYDTAVAERLLAPHGIAAPRFDEYAPKVVEHMRSQQAA